MVTASYANTPTVAPDRGPPAVSSPRDERRIELSAHVSDRAGPHGIVSGRSGVLVARSAGVSLLMAADGTGDPELDTLVELLGDDYARSILAATSAEPLSATELSDRFDASLSTVWRRLERLEDADLVTERTRPRQDGRHDSVYAANLDRIQVRFRDGQVHYEIDRHDENAADRLKRMWEDL